MAVKVVVQGVEVKDVEYVEGMTVAAALEAAVELTEKATISLDGKNIKMKNLNKTVVTDGSQIIVIPNVGNGS